MYKSVIKEQALEIPLLHISIFSKKMYPSIPSTLITTMSLQTDRPSPNYIHGRPPSIFNVKTTQLHRLYAKHLIYLAPLQPFPRFDVYIVRGPGTRVPILLFLTEQVKQKPRSTYLSPCSLSVVLREGSDNSRWSTRQATILQQKITNLPFCHLNYRCITAYSRY